MLRRLCYDSLYLLGCVLLPLLFGARVYGRRHEPLQGPVLILANHQSNLDPLFVGLACQRRICVVARETLFRPAPFRWLIVSLGAIPLDRDGGGGAGIRQTLRRLKAGEAVLIFPEGTRTHDGEIGPLKPGFVTLARRSGAALLPLAIEGSFQSWPRSRRLPRLARVTLRFAPPIDAAETARLDDRQLLAEVESRLRAAHAEARQRR